MKCINCGAPLEDKNAIFCQKCYQQALADRNKTNDLPEQQNEKLQPSADKGGRKKKNKKTVRNILLSVAAVLLILILIPTFWISSLFGKIKRGNLSSNLGIAEGSDLPFTEDVKNIALYGLDTRANDTGGRSDAILILSIDRIHKSIKLTSIARDSYIQFENGKHDKITHAWAYGKANLALKTLNRNFKMDITDYVTVNFYQFSSIIDYIGGIEIDVSEAEMKVMNKEYVPYLNDLGIRCDYIKEPGMQLLNGGQALAYARNRYTGGDVARGERQRKVLEAMYQKAKKISPLKAPKLVEMIFSECTTSLSNKEMLSIGLWAMTNSPDVKTTGVPNEQCPSHGEMIKGTSYVVYDLNEASKYIHKFIYTDGEETSNAAVTEKK